MWDCLCINQSNVANFSFPVLEQITVPLVKNQTITFRDKETDMSVSKLWVKHREAAVHRVSEADTTE